MPTSQRAPHQEKLCHPSRAQSPSLQRSTPSPGLPHLPRTSILAPSVCNNKLVNNPQPKQRIKVKRNSNGYERGKTYVIVRVDPNDNTLVAADSQGKEGSWISWRHCELCAHDINWNWLKAHLSSEALELLSAFENLENLRLKDDIRDQILLQLPNLKDRILSAQVQLEEQLHTSTVNTPAPGDDDDDSSDSPF